MKKNSTDEIYADFLSPLHFLMRLSGMSYEKYMVNKIYLHALNIRKSNELIYQMIMENIRNIPEELEQDCIALLNHYDCWLLQFKAEEQRLKPQLNDAFVFQHIDKQVGFPHISEQNIADVVEKIRKQNH